MEEAEIQRVLAGFLKGEVNDKGGGIPGASLAIHRPGGSKVATFSAGEDVSKCSMSIASASKLAASIVMLRLVTVNKISLNDNPEEVLLGQRLEHPHLKLDHLGNFTSGLADDEANSIWDASYSIEESAKAILANESNAAPGEQFDYNFAHFQVAAAVAEKVTGMKWNDIFKSYVKDPLNLSHCNELKWDSLPMLHGKEKPLVGGNLKATQEEMATLCRAVAEPAFKLNRGEELRADSNFIRPDLINRMFRNMYPQAAVGKHPMREFGFDFRYSFGAWLQEEPGSSEGDVISSPGALGFAPWIDRDKGYFAVLAMQGKHNAMVVPFIQGYPRLVRAVDHLMTPHSTESGAYEVGHTTLREMREL